MEKRSCVLKSDIYVYKCTVCLGNTGFMWYVERLSNWNVLPMAVLVALSCWNSQSIWTAWSDIAFSFEWLSIGQGWAQWPLWIPSAWGILCLPRESSTKLLLPCYQRGNLCSNSLFSAVWSGIVTLAFSQLWNS